MQELEETKKTTESEKTEREKAAADVSGRINDVIMLASCISSDLCIPVHRHRLALFN